MYIIITIVILIIVLLTGFISRQIVFKEISAEWYFVIEYLEKYGAFINSKGKDMDSYDWLTINAEKMQRQLGQGGLISYKMPFADKFIPNYPIVLNFISDIRAEFSHQYISNHDNFDYTVNCVRDALLREMGLCEEEVKRQSKLLWNPFFWIRDGVNKVLLFPFSFLNQFEVFSSKSINKIKSSIYFKIISAIITVVGFISAIIGIIIGWEDFIKILNKIKP